MNLQHGSLTNFSGKHFVAGVGRSKNLWSWNLFSVVFQKYFFVKNFFRAIFYNIKKFRHGASGPSYISESAVFKCFCEWAFFGVRGLGTGTNNSFGTERKSKTNAKLFLTQSKNLITPFRVKLVDAPKEVAPTSQVAAGLALRPAYTRLFAFIYNTVYNIAACEGPLINAF